MTFIVIGAIAALLVGIVYWRRRQRRARLLAAPLSSAHRAIVENRIPLIQKLPEELRPRFEGLVNRFLNEVKFHGAEGLEITDDMRVTIAAQACFLIVNKPNRWFKSLRAIHLYPAAFKSQIRSMDGHVHSERAQVRSGESWSKGPVVLAWDHAAYGAFLPHDGQNVVMHEFAHQLDDQTGVTDGAPLLDKNQRADEWAAAFQDAFDRIQKDVAAGREPAIDPYGATAPAEFFAVATEVFFEKPGHLRTTEPEIYRQLKQYYQLDPASWR